MSAAIIWLPGWSFGDDVFDRIRSQLPSTMRNIAVHNHHAAKIGDFYLAAAAAVQEAKQQHENDCLIAVGWSLGGMLALRLAAEGLIDGAVSIAAAPQFVRDAGGDRRYEGASSAQGWDARHLKRMQRALAGDRSEVERRFRSITLASGSAAVIANNAALDATDRLQDEQASFCSEWSNEALQAGLDFLLEEDLRPILSSIRCPLLLVHGAADAVCDVSAAAAIHAAVPHAELFRLEHTGHAPHLTEADAVADRLRRWLDEWLP
jgi:pimeloyl-[acyl-carrier protein] methyl ester esterase